MRILRQGFGEMLDWRAFTAGVVTAVALGVVAAFFWYSSLLRTNQILPGVSINGSSLSFLTPDEALTRLAETQPVPQTTLTVLAGSTTIASSSSQLALHDNTSELVQEAYMYGRQGTFWEKLQAFTFSLTQGKSYVATFTFDPIKVDELVTAVQNATTSEEVTPTAQLVSGKIQINSGKNGQSISSETARLQITEIAPMMEIDQTVNIPLQLTGTQLTPDAVIAAEQRASAYIGQTVEAKADINTVRLSDADLISALSLPTGFDQAKLDTLLDQVTQKINRPPQDAKFVFDQSTLKVTEFQPDLDGTTVDKDKARQQLVDVMNGIEQKTSTEKTHQFEASVTSQPAKVRLSDLNNLGIGQRIGFGESYYDHSIPSRVHNVSQAAKIVNLTIVKPGEEFSFNKTLGDVSSATGFQPAYVIKSGQTVLGDGGGVCQVSTTLFRALLDSGLNITKRRPHSYRVSYYELNKDPGFDATVYAGDVDLRFINDSPGHLLLQFETFPDIRYMRVSIYGTSDGRTAEIVDYQKWGARGPAPTQYIDDPTLPAGKLVQIDWAVGGINTKFTHRVKDKNGNIISEKTYTSNYVPWSAKYRRGTGI